MNTRVIQSVGVFLIVFGVARFAELAGWSRLHGDVVRMVGLGSGTVTALLLIGKGVELLLTALTVLALVRRRDVWLLAALAGWTADLALLTAVAAVCDAPGRLLEHGLFFLAFAGLSVLTYVNVRRVGAPPMAPGAPPPHGAPRRAGLARRDLASGGVTRQDIPLQGQNVTRQDLPVRRPPDA